MTTYYTLSKSNGDWEAQILLPDEITTVKLNGNGGPSEAKIRLDRIREGIYEQIDVDALSGRLVTRQNQNLLRPVLTLSTPHGGGLDYQGLLDYHAQALLRQEGFLREVWMTQRRRPEILSRDHGHISLLCDGGKHIERTAGVSVSLLSQSAVAGMRSDMLQRRWGMIRRTYDPDKRLRHVVPRMTALNGLQWSTGLDPDLHFLIVGNHFASRDGLEGLRLYNWLAHGCHTDDILCPLLLSERLTFGEENEISPVW